MPNISCFDNWNQMFILLVTHFPVKIVLWFAAWHESEIAAHLYEKSLNLCIICFVWYGLWIKSGLREQVSNNTSFTPLNLKRLSRVLKVQAVFESDIPFPYAKSCMETIRGPRETGRGGEQKHINGRSTCRQILFKAVLVALLIWSKEQYERIQISSCNVERILE